jgi:undecaprenyl diphosphate synthase
MDGNSRWAKKHSVTQMNGYLTGMRAIERVIVAAIEHGIEYLTFYAFSTENWKRPKAWISDFMNLAVDFFTKDESIKRILSIGARLKVIGDKSRLDHKYTEIINKIEEESKNNEDVFIQLAISYGGHDEIVRAVKKIIDLGLDITEENISANLDTSGIPNPQLIIRTGDKCRLSNFLIWQSYYSELYFTNILWPDFCGQDLTAALEEFKHRERTYGK